MTNQEFVELIHNNKMNLVWNQVAGLLTRYFRTKVVGARHLPKSGPAIIAPNHSGCCGLDVVVLSYIIRKITNRTAKTLAHKAYFDLSQLMRLVSESFGLRKASIQNGADVLLAQELLMIFPEAEDGNFKSSLHMYELQPFHTGFVRMALMTRSPIVPTLVIGAEESTFNLGNIDLSEYVEKLRIPMPVNLFPFPAKWQIKFMKPISVRKYKPEDAQNEDLIQELTHSIQLSMQSELLRLESKRKTIYL